MSATPKQAPEPRFPVLTKAYQRFLKIRGHPREIALGMALGLFIGMTPFMGLHTAAAVFLAAVFKWNKISAAAGVWVSNPATAPFVYGINFYIGSKLTGIKLTAAPQFTLDIRVLIDLISSTPELVLILTIGGLVTGVPLALIGYIFAYKAVEKYQRDLRAKLQQRRALRKAKRIRRRKKKQRSF